MPWHNAVRKEDMRVVGRRGVILFPVVALLGFGVAAQAQTSVYSKMSVVGDWQGWTLAPANMQLVSNNTWAGEVYLYPAATNRFKFVADTNWGSGSWGETNQADFVLPIEGTAEAAGGDIFHPAPEYGLYRFTFNDSTRAYRLEARPSADESPNLLRNPGFEESGSLTNLAARYWEWMDPDWHGGVWGTASRRVS